MCATEKACPRAGGDKDGLPGDTKDGYGGPLPKK
jgi:hypothetical protein